MSEPKNTNVYEKEFSDNSFWEKIKNFAKSAGKEVIEKALWLYFAAQSPQTPIWAKTTIYSALGYFIFPIDAIPDLTPLIGFTDDFGVLTAAIAAVAVHITDDVKEQAKQKLKDWFGE